MEATDSMKTTGFSEAYSRTLDAVEAIRAKGVAIKITSGAFDAVQEAAPLPKRKVVIIECSPKTKEEIGRISAIADELGWNAIGFTLDHEPNQDGGLWPMVFGVGFHYR